VTGLGRVIRAGVTRRRVQTVVVALVVLAAVSACVLGGSLLLAGNAPFERAFGQQRGAHLTATFDAAKVSAGQLAGTAHSTGVTASAGPFRTVSITPTGSDGQRLPSLTVVGRSDPAGAAVDRANLLSGRWPQRLGEIVLFSDGATRNNAEYPATEFNLTGLPGSPKLTVVGLARSVSRTAKGAVTPEQADALASAGAPTGYQMLYRLAATDEAGVAAGKVAIAAGLPDGALTGSLSWLTTRQSAIGQTVLLIPALLAFGVLGLVMAVLIVGNVVAGSVSAGTRRIGILKALGATPGQVVVAHLAQALIPAALGAVLGVVAGNLLVIPVLADTNGIYGTDDSGVAPWLDAVVLVGVLLVVAATAMAASARAGRLRTVEVLAAGHTPRPGRGRWAARLAGRLPLPRPVTVGVAHPFARPVRSLSVVVAIAFGVAAAGVAVGLATSLNRVQASQQAGDVQVLPLPPERTGPPPGGGSGPTGEPVRPQFSDEAAVVAAVTAQSGTAGYCTSWVAPVTVPGLSRGTDLVGVSGTGCARHAIVSGRWFSGAGEVVVATPLLTATGAKVGDTIRVTDRGTELSLRIVGEVFNTENRGTELLTDRATLAAAEPELAVDQFVVTLRPGADRAAYLTALNTALKPLGAVAEGNDDDGDTLLIIINGLTTLLTVLLLVVAGLGVVNLTLLHARERVRDLGVVRALGMTPRQSLTMVTASVLVTGVAGGALGAAVGVFAQRQVIGAMGRATGFRLPAPIVQVFSPATLVLLGLGGLAVAILGALPAAGWAARIRTATALRTE
jgi:putative ABC transport system permease protein